MFVGGRSPFLLFCLLLSEDSVPQSVWKEKGDVFPVFCEKLHIFVRTKVGDRLAWPNRKTVFSCVFVPAFHG